MNRKNHDVEKQRYWQRTIGDAARSGMSIREFCRQRRVKESQFYWWQRKLKAGRQERNKPSVQDRAASFAPDGRLSVCVATNRTDFPSRGAAGKILESTSRSALHPQSSSANTAASQHRDSSGSSHTSAFPRHIEPRQTLLLFTI